MPEIIIVCGLMGCGKTTFAKEYAKLHKYEYVDFDDEYHEKIQAKHYPEAVRPDVDTPKFIEAIIKMLNENPGKNFIIDSWFRWCKQWYEEPIDNTIQGLRMNIKHKIRIIYMFVQLKTILSRYLEKHKKAGTEKDIIDDYAITMKERQNNMLKKIGVAMHG